MEALTVLIMFGQLLNILVWTIRILGGLVLVAAFGCVLAFLVPIDKTPKLPRLPVSESEPIEPGQVPTRR